MHGLPGVPVAQDLDTLRIADCVVNTNRNRYMGSLQDSRTVSPASNYISIPWRVRRMGMATSLRVNGRRKHVVCLATKASSTWQYRTVCLDIPQFYEDLSLLNCC